MRLMFYNILFKYFTIRNMEFLINFFSTKGKHLNYIFICYLSDSEPRYRSARISR